MLAMDRWEYTRYGSLPDREMRRTAQTHDRERRSIDKNVDNHWRCIALIRRLSDSKARTTAIRGEAC